MITKKRNIELICKAMGWEKPIWCDIGANGYLTWKHKTMEDIAEIKAKTGIVCKLTNNRNSRVIVPYYYE